MAVSNSGNCVGNCAGIGVGSASGIDAGGLICFGCKPIARIGPDRLQSCAWRPSWATAVPRLQFSVPRVQAEAKRVFSAMELSK